MALHEVTHAVQFAGVPWLHAHVAGLVRELLKSAEVRLDAPRKLQVPSLDEVKRVLTHLRRGDLISIVTTTPEREMLDRVQAVMAVIEGHAEHVMDAVAPDLLPSLPEAARRARSPSQVAVGAVAAGRPAARARAQAAPVRAGQVLLRRDRARARPGRAAPHVVEPRGSADARRDPGSAGMAGARDAARARGTAPVGLLGRRRLTGAVSLRRGQPRLPSDSPIHKLFMAWL